MVEAREGQADDARRLERRRGARREAGGDDSGVRDQQRAPEAQLARELAHARERARPEHEAGRARELERRHGPVGPAPPSASDQSWLRFMMKSAPFAGTAVA